MGRMTMLCVTTVISYFGGIPHLSLSPSPVLAVSHTLRALFLAPSYLWHKYIGGPTKHNVYLVVFFCRSLKDVYVRCGLLFMACRKAGPRHYTLHTHFLFSGFDFFFVIPCFLVSFYFGCCCFFFLFSCVSNIDSINSEHEQRAARIERTTATRQYQQPKTRKKSCVLKSFYI